MDVEAASVYEAAVLAVRAFRSAGFMELMPGPARRFEVSVMAPAVQHEVCLGQVQRWLEQGASDPREVSRRKTLKELLEAN